ncbi:hypothetical protein Tco_0609073 [Tanacetum coccineum]
MSFSKRSDTAIVCYTKPLDSLKHWNDSFFWVDALVFPLSVPWHTKKTVMRDPSPTVDEFSAKVSDFLATHLALFWKLLKSFLCLVEMDLFAFIRHADPTKVRIDKRQIEEGHVPLLESTRGHVIPLVSRNDKEISMTMLRMLSLINLTRGDVQDVVVGKPKGIRRKRKPAGGASYSDLPPKKLRDDYGTSSDVSAKTAGKSLVGLQGLLECNTLASEVGVTEAVTVPFVTSSVTPTPERKGYVTGHNLRMRNPAKRFFISSDSSHHSSTNVADVELDSIVRPSMPIPLVMTAIVATTVVADTSYVLVLRAANEPFFHTPFRDSASTGEAGQEVAGPSNPARTELSVCRSMVDQLAPPGFFSQFQVATVKAAEAARVNNLDDLKARHLALLGEKGIIERQVATLEFAVFAKEAESASLESKKDNLADQVSSLETICSGLRDQISSYELFKEQYEEVQDEQVKVLSDQVAGLDVELMGMALHLDEEFYPYFLTTIAGRRWIISRGFWLAVMKCLQSLEYVAALGTTIGLAIDKGMQSGLAAGIDHGKARRSLTKKDAFIVDIMSLLHLEGPFTETPEGIKLQPSYEQLFLPIYQTKDNANIKEGASSCRLSLWDIMGPLVEPLSSENLVGEASTSGVPVTVVVTTALSTTFAQTGMLKLMMRNCMLKLLLLS